MCSVDLNMEPLVAWYTSFNW